MVLLFKLNSKWELLFMNRHETVPEDAHIPLVVMTVFTQMSLGGFFALFLGDFLFILGFNLPAPSAWMAMTVFLPGAAGLLFSMLHLGRPFKAPTALINLKTSWLSREALALGVFTSGMLIVTLTYFFSVDRFFRFIWESVVLGIGIYGIYAQSMIYRLDARPSWNGFMTTAIFFGTGYTGVLLLGFSALLQGSMVIVSPIMALALLLGSLQTVLSNEFHNAQVRTDKQRQYPEFKKTGILMTERFRKIYFFRQFMLYTGAIGLPLMVTVLLAAQSTGWAIGLLACALVASTVCELAGRYLFFVTGVSVGLP